MLGRQVPAAICGSQNRGLTYMPGDNTFLPQVRTFVSQVSLRTSLKWDLTFSRLPQIILVHSKNYTIPLGSETVE